VMFAAELRQLRMPGFNQGLHIVTSGRLYRRSTQFPISTAYSGDRDR
jgi:hypothetical protein